MKKVLLFILLASSVLSHTIKAQITATQMGMLDFKVSQSLVANDMNGTNDVTTKLQAAVNAASAAGQTLFIPSGTYKVSNTINCVMQYSGWSAQTVVNIVGSSKNRPTIVLANSSSGFSGTNPKCVIIYSATVHTTPDCIMEGGIRSINFDLGTGNTKAVAVNWGCAQYCYIEDISVEARSGFAGLMGIGGANNLLGNVSVDGGQYGIYLPNNSEATAWGLSGEICQSTITGCTFTNQTINALHLWGYGGITMSGITIVQSSGTAIMTQYDGYAPVIQFPFSLIDSRITFSTPSSSNVAINNITHMSMAMNGVYVIGAGTVCNNNGDENLATLTPISSWTHVARFNYIDKAIRKDGSSASYTGTHYNALGGTASTVAIVQTDTTSPPSDLTSKHIWATTPSFEDTDAVLVPAGSTAAQIQAAINANPKVCLAKGTYTLSTPITLRANSIFFGCPGLGRCGTIFVNGFTPTSASWLITTENSATATTYMMDIATSTTNIDYMGSVNWQAGANSIIRTIWLDRGWQDYERNIVRLNFSNNGGGRVFNYQDEKGNGGTTAYYNSGHRKVRVSGTSQQLTFYGLDLERGGALYPVSTWPMLEIVNASKVRIFGAKTEAFQPYATINGCNDIFITNVVDYCANGYGSTGANQIEISGTNDKIELSNMIWTGSPATSWKLVLDPWNANEPSRQQFLGVYHYNWSTISDVVASVPVTGVSVSPVSLSLNTGSTGQLSATVAPTNASNKAVTWSSSNTAIATVSSTGLVTAIAGGNATITVTTQNGGKTATCAVTVTAVNIAVTGVNVSPTTASISVGGSSQLIATVVPANATNKTVTWSSSNTAAATVSASGLVTAVATGIATITVTTQDGSFTATTAITVTTTPTNIALNKTATASTFETGNTVANGNDGSTTTRWCASSGALNEWWKVDLGTMSNITGTEITWEKNSVYKYKIEVSSDNVTWTMAANKTTNAASAQIMSDNFTASARYVRITVTGLVSGVWTSFFEFKVWGSTANVPVTGVSVSPTTASVIAGATSQLTASVAPSTATNKTITWSSGNTAVATVNSNGLVTAVAIGTSTITATTQDGSFTATSAITVTAAPACTGTYIPRTTTAPIIDQTIDAIWTNAPIGTITHVTAGTMPSDFAGTQWRTMYDNTKLYILVEVKDANKYNDSGTAWWNDDVVEVYIDGNNSKGTAYDGVNDFQLAFRYNDATVELGGNSVTRTTGIQFAQQAVTGGYNMEISIPWTTIGVTPTAGNLMGFDISVGDDDNGDVRDAQVTAFDNTGNAYQNPSTFGTVTLCGTALKSNFCYTTSAVNQTNPLDYIKLFPNPASTKIAVELSSFMENESIMIYSTNGRFVKKIKVLGLTQQVNIDDLPNGMYIVRLSGHPELIAKFIKQ